MIKTSLQSISLASVLLIGCAPPPEAQSATPRPPLDPKELLGVWIGYDQNSAWFYRLVFEESGTGSCVGLFESNFSCAYQIRWAVNGRDLSLSLAPLTKEAEKVNVTVTLADESELRIRVKGQERDWEHRLLVHREDTTLQNIKKCVEMQKKISRQ